jgi:5'-nucleotidase
LRIITDLDGIVVNHTKLWFFLYNADFHDNLVDGDIKDWDTSKFVKLECGKKIFDYLAIPGFFENLEPHRGAIDALVKLQQRGHEVVICTATEVPEAAKGKMIWVKKHLPFISKNNFIITSGKHHVQGDVLIDDGPHNAETYRQAHPGAIILGIKYPYNEKCTAYDFNAPDWRDTQYAWNQILKVIK